MTAPLATLIVMTHNHARFVSTSLDAALAQDYRPLEIIVSDDASADGTADIVQSRIDSYRGPIQARAVRQRRNLGVADHQSACMAMARGEVVVIADGDDVAYPNRVRTQVDAILTHQVSCATSNARAIDAEGRTIGATTTESESRTVDLESFVSGGWLPIYLGATLAFHREVIDTFGAIDAQKTPDANDHIMPMRAALLRGIRYVAEPLLDYRVLQTSQTAGFGDRTGTTTGFRETMLAYEIGAQVMQLDQLMRVLGKAPDDSRLNRARAILTDRMTHHADRWLRARAILLQAGFTPDWVERAKLESRAIKPQLRNQPDVLDAQAAAPE